MTPEEQFSSSIMTDFLGDSDDDDLQDYIETEIYKYAQNYNGVSMLSFLRVPGLFHLKKTVAIKILFCKNI